MRHPDHAMDEESARVAPPLLSVQDLNVVFNIGQAQTLSAVRHVSFDVPANSTVALVGESGSGKSVSAMAIVRLLPDNAVISNQSRVLYQGKNLLTLPTSAMRKLRGSEISVVFQDPMSSLNPVFTVGDQIAEVLQVHRAMSARQARNRAVELLDEVGISNARARLGAYAHELSGGQQQRVMIAMAIACEPKLLIADEPTTALDVTVQRQVMELLAKLQRSHSMSILFISHDLALVGEIADQVVVMRHGEVKETGSVRQIFNAPQHAYTQALLSCRPPLAGRPSRLPVIEDIIQQKPAITEQRLQTPKSGSALIEVIGLQKQYSLKTGLFKRTTLHAVRHADFAVFQGRTLGIVGESGSGKTTLGMLLTLLTTPTAGKIVFEGVDMVRQTAAQIRAYRKRVQIIFQNPYASLNPRFTVGQSLMEPMRIHNIGVTEEDRTRRALSWIDQVGLPKEAFAKYPHEFSGGQRQRIAIARCLTMQPDVIVCDESVSALDVSVQATVLNLLLDLQERFKLTYIFISHDLSVVKYMADDILVMSQGDIVESGSAEVVYNTPKHAYTQKLLAAVPRGLGARTSD